MRETPALGSSEMGYDPKRSMIQWCLGFAGGVTLGDWPAPHVTPPSEGEGEGSSSNSSLPRELIRDLTCCIFFPRLVSSSANICCILESSPHLPEISTPPVQRCVALLMGVALLLVSL